MAVDGVGLFVGFEIASLQASVCGGVDLDVSWVECQVPKPFVVVVLVRVLRKARLESVLVLDGFRVHSTGGSYFPRSDITLEIQIVGSHRVADDRSHDRSNCCVQHRMSRKERGDG